jgi:deazaflavin-dependent oxidoreductase (nitroreductase family)
MNHATPPADATPVLHHAGQHRLEHLNPSIAAHPDQAPAPRQQPPDQPHRYSIRNRLLNPIVKLLLTSPLHPLLSRGLLLITYTGTRTGRPHTLPVQYARAGGRIVILAGDGIHKRWWRNLRRPAPVQLRIRGTAVDATGYVIVDNPDRSAELTRLYLDRFPRARRVAATAAVVCVDLEPTS